MPRIRVGFSKLKKKIYIRPNALHLAQVHSELNGATDLTQSHQGRKMIAEIDSHAWKGLPVSLSATKFF